MSKRGVIREALEYQERESLVGPLFPEALAALDEAELALDALEEELAHWKTVALSAMSEIATVSNQDRSQGA